MPPCYIMQGHGGLTPGLKSGELRRSFAHYHEERPHQGKGNVVLVPSAHDHGRDGLMRCRERLGGLLKYYTREAA
jgi:putative transposase